MKKIVAVAWLNEADWSRWQAIDPELPSYERWREKVNAGIAAMETGDVCVRLVTLDPDVFAGWCRVNGRAIDRTTRAMYAGAEAMKALA